VCTSMWLSGSSHCEWHYHCDLCSDCTAINRCDHSNSNPTTNHCVHSTSNPNRCGHSGPRLYTDCDCNHCGGGCRCATDGTGTKRRSSNACAIRTSPCIGTGFICCAVRIAVLHALRKTNLTELTILQIVRFTSVRKDYAQEFRYATNG
jgi:hypothetical protein